MSVRKPVWEDESRASACYKCRTAFSIFNRKHHCRACGKVFCNSCTSNNLTIPKYVKFYGNEPVRVCDTCFYKEKHEIMKQQRNASLQKAHTNPNMSPIISTLPSATLQNTSQPPGIPARPSTPTNNTPAPIITTQDTTPATDSSKQPASYASLPTSVRKDMMSKNVVNSIFSSGDDIFGSSTPTAKVPAKPVANKPNIPSRSNTTTDDNLFNLTTSISNQTDDFFSLPSKTVVPAASAVKPNIPRNPTPPTTDPSMFTSHGVSPIKPPTTTTTTAASVPAPASNLKPTSIISPDFVPETEPFPSFLDSPVSTPLKDHSRPSTHTTASSIASQTNNTINNIAPIQPSPPIPQRTATPVATTPTPTPAIVQNPTPAATTAPPAIVRPATQAAPAVKAAAAPTATRVIDPTVSPYLHQKTSAELLAYPSPSFEPVFIPPRDGGVEITEKARIMQEKLFLRYANAYLGQRGMVMNNFVPDFVNGVLFIMLVECTSQVPLPEELSSHCAISPTSRDDCYRNFYFALCHLTNIGKQMPAVDIDKLIDGDISAILDLIWGVCYRNEIEYLQTGDQYGIGAILGWVNSIIVDYPVQFYDFKKSFEDGMVLCAIIHHFNPDLFSFGKLLPHNKLGNLNQAFDLAQQTWGIPKLLDAEDTASDPDDVCMIIYLGFYCKFMS